MASNNDFKELKARLQATVPLKEDLPDSRISGLTPQEPARTFVPPKQARKIASEAASASSQSAPRDEKAPQPRPLPRQGDTAVGERRKAPSASGGLVRVRCIVRLSAEDLQSAEDLGARLDVPIEDVMRKIASRLIVQPSDIKRATGDDTGDDQSPSFYAWAQIDGTALAQWASAFDPLDLKGKASQARPCVQQAFHRAAKEFFSKGI